MQMDHEAEQMMVAMQRQINQLTADNNKLNRINGAILKAITEKGSLTLREYNALYAGAVQVSDNPALNPRPEDF